MSENVTGADNQQGSPLSNRVIVGHDPSETTRRAPFPKDEIIAYFQGALHDASLNKGRRYRFTQKNLSWLQSLSEMLYTLGYRSWIYKEGKNRNVYALETLAEFLDFGLDPESLLHRQERIGYIRGFFDAEGGIPHKKDNRFYIQFVQKNKPKLQKLSKILFSLGIQTGVIHNPSKKVDPEYWRFFVRTESHYDFADIIGSWHLVKAKIFRERMKI